MAARYGGEEFALLLPETDENGARHLAQKIITDIKAQGIEHQSSTVESVVTVSIGIASYPQKEIISPKTLIQMADQALYRAKQCGRNQVSV